MGQRLVDFYDEQRIVCISGEVAAAIDAATFGSGSWDSVPAALSGAFPGSFSALWNMNFAASRLNFLSFQNLDPVYAKSFTDHFAFINPWTAYWESVRSGLAAASEDVFPARRFADTEFYNDWLRPQKDVEAAVGMKLVGDQRELVNIILHFPISVSDNYSKAAVEILSRVRGNLERSIAFGRLMRVGAEGAVSGAALVERSRCAAFVVEGDRLLRDANQAAEHLFSSGQSVAIRNGRCFLADNNADMRFGLTLQSLSRGVPTDGHRLSFQNDLGAWQVAMAPLPAPPPSRGVLSLLPPNRMVLVLVTDLRLESQNAADFSTLSATFGLTPSEIAFCARLAQGESVTEAAEQLCITVETARTRLKTILQKTNTSRQGQLMLLLSRLA